MDEDKLGVWRQSRLCQPDLGSGGGGCVVVWWWWLWWEKEEEDYEAQQVIAGTIFREMQQPLNAKESRQ